MPDCETCKYRNGQTCRAYESAKVEFKRPIPPPPSGACTYAIVEQYLPLIKKGMKVLEVGCGTWPKIRDYTQSVGAHYEGLDVQEEYYGIKSIATKFENLAELSFSDQTFDLVIGNQTMEHWGEHGCDTIWGLYQCFRVTKPGGRVFMNVPMHFHGTRPFLHGDTQAIQKLFQRFSNSIEIEAWGKNSQPIAPFFAHPSYSALKYKSAYVLDVRAVRDRELPKNINNRWGFSGRLAQIVHYSPSYNFHRLWQKLFHA